MTGTENWLSVYILCGHFYSPPSPHPGSLLYTLCFGTILQKFWIFLPPLKLVLKRVLWPIWKYLLQIKVAWITIKSTPELWRCSRQKREDEDHLCSKYICFGEITTKKVIRKKEMNMKMFTNPMTGCMLSVSVVSSSQPQRYINHKLT